MTTLVEFLLARIDEQADAAEQAATHPHLVGHTMSCDWWGDVPGSCTCDAAARVLADCAARRAIVRAFEEERPRRDIYNRGYDDGLLTTSDDLRSRLASNALCRGLEIALQALATPYAGHPDYCDDWRL